MNTTGPQRSSRSRRGTPSWAARRAPRSVLDDPLLDGRHAMITISAQGVILEDLNSTNGVYLGIADAFSLEHGDEIAIGRQRVVFFAHGEFPPFFSAPTPSTTPIQGGPIASPVPFLVRVMEGGSIGAMLPLHQPSVVIGRGPQSHLCCPEDALLEERHASIERRGTATFALNDLKSAFGTYIRLSAPVELIPGDCFLIGRSRCRIHA